jgi:hypothetical protein
VPEREKRGEIDILFPELPDKAVFRGKAFSAAIFFITKLSQTLLKEYPRVVICRKKNWRKKQERCD